MSFLEPWQLPNTKTPIPIAPLPPQTPFEYTVCHRTKPPPHALDVGDWPLYKTTTVDCVCLTVEIAMRELSRYALAFMDAHPRIDWYQQPAADGTALNLHSHASMTPQNLVAVFNVEGPVRVVEA